LEIRAKPLILVVDDQLTILKIITKILQPTYDVCTAMSGKQALEIASSQMPDLILLDNMMPEMTGVETCMSLKQDPETEHIPVIFVTSMDDKHNEQIGFKAGAVDYMTKPPSPELVLARVRVQLKSHEQRLFLEELAKGEYSDTYEIQRIAIQLLQDH